MKAIFLSLFLLLSIVHSIDSTHNYIDHFEAHNGPVGCIEIFEVQQKQKHININTYQKEFDVIITGGALDKLIRVWDINTHDLKFELKGHDKSVWSLTKFSVTNSILVFFVLFMFFTLSITKEDMC